MDVRDVTVIVDDIKLWAQLYLPDGKPPYPVLCICHGIPAVNASLAERGYPLMAEQVTCGKQYRHTLRRMLMLQDLLMICCQQYLV